MSVGVLIVLVAGLLIETPNGGADPGPVVSSVSGTCTAGPPDYGEHLLTVATPGLYRFTAAVGPGKISSGGAPTSFYGPDVVWGSVYPPEKVVVDCSAVEVPFEIEYFDEPTAPVSFSGATTPGPSGPLAPTGSQVMFYVPRQTQYLAEVTLAKGTVIIELARGIRPRTLISSGTYQLGMLSVSSGHTASRRRVIDLVCIRNGSGGCCLAAADGCAGEGGWTVGAEDVGNRSNA
jgi:hypothetical protein